MARVLKGSHSFTYTPTRSTAIGMSHTYLCVPSYRRYSFTDPRRMEGWVGCQRERRRLWQHTFS